MLNSESKIQNSKSKICPTRHSGCAAIPHPANPVLLSKVLSEPEIHSIPSHEESAKCAQIAKEWLDIGLAKCHEVAVFHPSSRNPPAWIEKIHGISFVDTSAQIPPVTSHSQLHHAGVAKREG